MGADGCTGGLYCWLLLLMMICFKDGFAVGLVRCYRYALCSSRCGLFRWVGFDI